MNTALLVIDLQQEFFNNSKLKPSLDHALEYVNEVIEIFEKAKRPVFYIQDQEAGQGGFSGDLRICV